MLKAHSLIQRTPGEKIKHEYENYLENSQRFNKVKGIYKSPKLKVHSQLGKKPSIETEYKRYLENVDRFNSVKSMSTSPKLKSYPRLSY